MYESIRNEFRKNANSKMCFDWIYGKAGSRIRYPVRLNALQWEERDIGRQIADAGSLGQRWFLRDSRRHPRHVHHGGGRRGGG